MPLASSLFAWHLLLGYAAVWLLLQSRLIIIVHGLGASCRCVTFTDTYGKEYGVFTSPNWPVPYDESVNCLLYTFQAAPDQLVEITFDEFDVQKTSLDCIYADFVKLFLHLDTGSLINDDTVWTDVLCGKIADIEQTHYSSSSSLVFEFHSDWRAGNNTGFRGTYRFLSKRLFETDAVLLPQTRCDYKFESLSTVAAASSLPGNGSSRQLLLNTMTSSQHHHQNQKHHPQQQLRSNRGRFYSPQYPSTYPKSIQCAYIFEGQASERVKLVFEHIMLQKSDLSCLNSPDVIYVHDGPNKLSPVIGQLCNTNTFVDLVSTNNHLYMQFLSRSHFPGQGFKGRYYFEPINVKAPQHQQQQLAPNVQTSMGINCDFNFSSDVAKNGTFNSPNYPETYPERTICNYQFNGSGKERIQILFTDFDLYLPDDLPINDLETPTRHSCESVDTVMVFVVINGKKERIDNFCGAEMPAQLMSNGPSLRVEFRSGGSIGTRVRGFKAIYNFITSFGITTGVQDHKRGVCAFVYNSSHHPDGTFSSPNWPGLYPRDTECHYFFYGQSNQRVHITFAYFDIEGIPPCNAEGASDYLEFSNYQTVDRKIPRHCGVKKPTLIASDNEFFRVIFKSNDKFDATGFEAFYQFRNDSIEDNSGARRMSASSPSNTISYRLCLFLIAFALLWQRENLVGRRGTLSHGQKERRKCVSC